MNKKIICFIIILLLFGSLYTISNAVETGTVYLTSNKNKIEKGDEIEIAVNLKNSATAAFDFSLYFDTSKFEYISKLDNTNVVDNRVIFVWYDNTGGEKAKQGEIAKLKFKAKEDGLATFSVEGEFYNNFGQTIKTEFEEMQVQIGKEKDVFENQENEGGTNTDKDNAKLQTLRLGIEGITPEFEKEVYEYYLTVTNDVKDIDVLAISQNSNAIIEITGNKNLKEGLNTIKIDVTSENKKQKKSYVIHVTKTKNIELANTNLEILAIENTFLNPPFDINETKYNAEVSFDTEKLNILAIPENEKATLQISGAENLKEGNNTIEILVTAPNGISKKKYEIKVYRRNKEEQIKYEQTSKKEVEKVKAAYEIANMLNEEKVDEEEKNDVKSNNNIVVIMLVVTLVVAIIIGRTKLSKGT